MIVNQPRVLIIEDEAQIRKFLRISLESQGYTITEAVNGSEGLSSATTTTFDLVILDLGLPDMNGQRVIKKLRQKHNMPIIVLSVRASENEKIQALDSGANDYVTKPFAIGELMARIRVLLRQSQSIESAPDKIEINDLVIDAYSREVYLDNEQLHLSRKEFELLHLLAIQPGRILTHQMLLRTIWGETFTHETHYLRVLIGHLRQKLGDDPMNPQYITTVQGVGYRLKT